MTHYEPLVPYAMRHTFATNAYALTGDLKAVSEAIGHKSLKMTERYVEAADWCRFAQEHAPNGDVVAQFSWRALHAKLLARDGLLGEGEAEAAKALGMVARTDLLTHHGNALLDGAHVLRLAGRPPAAAKRIEEALFLFESKGNLASATIARSLLDQAAVF